MKKTRFADLENAFSVLFPAALTGFSRIGRGLSKSVQTPLLRAFRMESEGVFVLRPDLAARSGTLVLDLGAIGLDDFPFGLAIVKLHHYDAFSKVK